MASFGADSAPRTSFLCSVCGKLPDVVVQSPCCSQVYCWNCVTIKRQNCFICSQPLNSNFMNPNPTLQEKIDRARAKNSSLQCPQKCGKTVPINLLNDHFQRCPNWVSKCGNCGDFISRMTTNHNEVCSKTLVECEFAPFGCAQKIPRDQYQLHIQENVHIHYLMHTVKQQSDSLRALQETVTPTLGRRSNAGSFANYPNLHPEPSAPPYLEAENQPNGVVNPPFPRSSSAPLISPQEFQIPPFVSSALVTASALLETFVRGVLSKLDASQRGNLTSFFNSAAQYISSSLNENGVQSMAKLAVAGLVILVLKGPLMFLVNLVAFLFVCFSSFRYLESTALFRQPNLHPYGVLGFGLWVFYLMFIMF